MKQPDYTAYSTDSKWLIAFRVLQMIRNKSGDISLYTHVFDRYLNYLEGDIAHDDIVANRQAI